MLIKQKEKPELPFNLDTVQANPASDKSGTSIEVAGFPVHTMESDLKSMELGGKEKIPVPSQSPSFQQSITIKKTKKSVATGKWVSVLVLILILAIIAAGGYYFWMTRVKNMSDDTVPINAADHADQDPAGTSQPGTDDIAGAAFSENQANYLSVDIQSITTIDLQATLKKTADKVAQMNAIGPIEFIVTDKNNNPVSFQDFAQKLGLALPPSILAQLNPTFSFYVCANSTQPRFGLAISEKNNFVLESAMAQEEKNLTHDFEALFLDPSYKLDSTTIFSHSVYNNNQIRYINIPGATNLSLDYAFFNNQLIIGTSKLTIRAILDHYQTANPTAK